MMNVPARPKAEHGTHFLAKDAKIAKGRQGGRTQIAEEAEGSSTVLSLLRSQR